MADLIFEIGCEEMPARFVRPALEVLKRESKNLLIKDRLYNPYKGPSNFPFAGSKVLKSGDAFKVFGTPRRLALVCDDLDEHQPDSEEQALGPPLRNAFDEEGNPTKAALGFAKSQGVDVSQLQTIDTEKGERLGLVKQIKGRSAYDVLPSFFNRITLLLAQSFPKTMRWGSESFRFARPIHWFLAVLDGRVVPFELAGIKSGNYTKGHRFMAPGEIEVLSSSEYLKKLSEAYVYADYEERYKLTQMEVETTAQVGGGKLVSEGDFLEKLLEEVTNLVELPVACCGTFDPEFLEVPREVIISAMREHQRYFALEDAGGKLLNKFIAVNNTKPKDLAVVTAGHEKVLRARLSDARFFLTEDMKRPLIERLEDLKQVTYHAKLGTSFEKVERFAALAKAIAERIAPDKAAQVERAARLAKCDLVTEMVGEFPDLQGVVGTEYALRAKEPEEKVVAEAIYQHYMPTGAGSDLPESLVGACVGLADRLDTICGMFGIGKAPTGAADPFGLRRAAIGVIRIITEKGLSLPLSSYLDVALAHLEPWLHKEPGKKETQGTNKSLEKTKLEVFNFILDRLQNVLAEQGVPTDVSAAVLAVSREKASEAFLNPDRYQLAERLDDLVHIKAKAQALAQVKETEAFKPLAIGMKRVMNILRKEADQVPSTQPSAPFMTEAAEKDLYTAYKNVEEKSLERLEASEYLELLQGLSALKGPIDKFFDDVLVMDKDDKVRANRLAMLNEIAEMFRQVAEFTHLQLA